MNRYAKGANFERDVVELFKSVGFTACRTAGSHGLFDVIAISTHKERIYFISCKTDRKLPTEEWNALVLHAEIYGGVAILASKHPAGGVKLEWLVTRKKARENPASEVTLYEDRGSDVRADSGETASLLGISEEAERRYYSL